jgi:hypothetical protein
MIPLNQDSGLIHANIAATIIPSCFTPVVWLFEKPLYRNGHPHAQLGDFSQVLARKHVSSGSKCRLRTGTMNAAFRIENRSYGWRGRQNDPWEIVNLLVTSQVKGGNYVQH